jgi:hypothetical protein
VMRVTSGYAALPANTSSGDDADGDKACSGRR